MFKFIFLPAILASCIFQIVNSIKLEIGLDGLGTQDQRDRWLHYKEITRGFRGQNGLKGFTGITGDLGEMGEDGNKGNKGFKGDQGLPGPWGAKGSKGAKGDSGDKGNQGTKGEAGERGRPGMKGRRGDKGAKGSIGVSSTVQGEIGDKGEKGNSQIVVDKLCQTLSCPINSFCLSYMDIAMCICDDGLSGKFCLIENPTTVNDNVVLSFVTGDPFTIPCHYKPYRIGYSQKMQVRSGFVFVDFTCPLCTFTKMDFNIPRIDKDISGEYRCQISDVSNSVVYNVHSYLEKATFAWSECSSECGTGKQYLTKICKNAVGTAYVCNFYPHITQDCYTNQVEANCRRCWQCLTKNCTSMFQQRCPNVNTACFSNIAGADIVEGGCDVNGACPISTTPTEIPAPFSWNGKMKCCYGNLCNQINSV